jgi:hypothetical protein
MHHRPPERSERRIVPRHPAPLVPLRIFQSRTLAGADVLTILIGTVAVGMPSILTLGISSVVLALTTHAACGSDS